MKNKLMKIPPIVIRKHIIKLVLMLSLVLILAAILYSMIPGDNEKNTMPLAENNNAGEELPVIEISSSPDLIPENKGSTFFAEYRMERDRVRGQQIDMLKEMMDNQQNDQKTKELASLRLIKISEDIDKEMKAENLIKTEGIAECVVISEAGKTTIVVQSDPLSKEQEKRIRELLGQVIECEEDKVFVIVK